MILDFILASKMARNCESTVIQILKIINSWANCQFFKIKQNHTFQQKTN